MVGSDEEGELLASLPDVEDELGDEEPCDPCCDDEDEPCGPERRLSLLEPGEPTASGCTP